jgi:uncharacterized surface protein with fasciclin (FAS1) repeats
MMIRIRTISLSLLCLALTCSCRKWENYNKVIDPAQAVSLLETIRKNPELSQFSAYLTATGYDKVLASSKSFTIWAPTNAALAKVSPEILQDTARLKQLIGNHIASQAYLTSSINDLLFVKTLNGKNVTFRKTSVDDQKVLTADQYVGNGVLHVIGDAIVPKLNVWEYMMSVNTLHAQELTSLNYTFFDRSQAQQTGIDPNTGVPVYKPGTGVITLNRFTDASSIANEDTLFTYIALTDAAFTAEHAKLAQFYDTGIPTVSDSLTRFNIIKNLSFKGILNADAFPDTVYSAVDSVKFHLRKADVVETHRVSNGVVYVMSAISYKLFGERNDPFAKIKPITIQGEAIDSMMTAKNPTFRTRRNPDGSLYTDMTLVNSGVASFWMNYRTGANAVKYRVYWRVVRDNAAGAITLSGAATDLVYSPQRLAFDSPANIVFTVAKPGTIENGTDPVTGKKLFLPDYSEVLLGDFTNLKYSSKTLGNGSDLLNLFLVGNSVTTNGQNTLLLDYIKLVPIPN